jgi:hypothetical protein
MPLEKKKEKSDGSIFKKWQDKCTIYTTVSLNF